MKLATFIRADPKHSLLFIESNLFFSSDVVLAKAVLAISFIPTNHSLVV